MTRRVEIRFVVYGEPAPQGSKTVGRTKEGGSFVREDNPATAPWRNAVVAAAVEAMRGRSPFVGPVRLDLLFRFARPTSHFGTGRNIGKLKPSAPRVHAARLPDVDKLVRAVADSLSGVVYVDDRNVVELVALKHWGTPSASVAVTVLDPSVEPDSVLDVPEP